MNAKILEKHDDVHCIQNNYILKCVDNDEYECINYTLPLLHKHMLLQVSIKKLMRNIQLMQ